TNRVKDPDGPNSRDVRSVLRNVKADPDMALGAKVINLVRLQAIEQLDQIHGISQVAVVEKETDAVDVRVLVKMIDPRGIKGAGAPDNSVNLVALRKQEVRQIGSILAGNPGDQSSFHG